MLRRISMYNEQSVIHSVCGLRNKFNNALNDAVAKIDQYILTINSCNPYEDFNKRGNLSEQGKLAYWTKIGDLIQRFEAGMVKLLPNPKNPPHSNRQPQVPMPQFDYMQYGSRPTSGHDRFHHQRCKLPVPSTYHRY